MGTMRWVRGVYAGINNKRGPTYMALTMCDYEKEVGLTSSQTARGKRWACKTCFNFAPPVWSDRPDKCPTTEEALIEYGEWLAKGNNGTKPWTKGMMGNDVR